MLTNSDLPGWSGLACVNKFIGYSRRVDTLAAVASNITVLAAVLASLLTRFKTVLVRIVVESFHCTNLVYGILDVFYRYNKFG